MKTLQQIAALCLSILILGSPANAEPTISALGQDPPDISATHWDKYSPKCGATFDACPSNSQCTQRLEATCAPPECPGECRPKAESGLLACKRHVLGPGSRQCLPGYYCRHVGQIGGDSGGECVEGTCPSGLPSKCIKY